MMSLSKEWSILSKNIYGQSFINELSGFLKDHDVENILECCCGDGNILQGLAKKGFRGVGLDSSAEMISLARKNHSHPNIKYLELDLRCLNSINNNFDIVICRGGSLMSCTTWDKPLSSFDHEESSKFIIDSIRSMYSKLEKGGLIYLDTASDKEKPGKIELKFKDLHLNGTISYDLDKKMRITRGSGIVDGEYFSGECASYLLTSNELEEIVKSIGPQKVWRQALEHETHYDIVCAKK